MKNKQHNSLHQSGFGFLQQNIKQANKSKENNRGYHKMQNTYGGYVKMFVGWQENPIFESREDYCQIWLFLMMRANYQDGILLKKGIRRTIQRGSLFTTWKEISLAIYQNESSVSKVRTAIRKFENDNMISLKDFSSGRNVGKIITITNYNHYQSLEFAPSVYYIDRQKNMASELFASSKDSVLSNKLLKAGKRQANDRQMTDYIIIKDKQEKHINKKKESIKKENTNLLYKKEEKEEEDIDNIKDRTKNKHTEILDNIKTLFLNTTNNAKCFAKPEMREKINNFFLEKNLKDAEIEYLFEKANQEVLQKSTVEQREQGFTIGYLFQKIQDQKFYNTHMTEFQKIQDAKEPQETITENLIISVETENNNKKFHELLQNEHKHGYNGLKIEINDKWFNKYDYYLKDNVKVGYFDKHRRILRLHFSKKEDHIYFQYGFQNVEKFLLKFLKEYISDENYQNILVLPVFSESKVINWKYTIQEDIFTHIENEEKRILMIKEQEEKCVKDYVKRKYLEPVNNYCGFGYIIEKGVKVYSDKINFQLAC